MSEAVVEIENVSKTFDEIMAVDSVTLRLERGRTLGLIGPNGAGKTTLLRMICSLARPDSGEIRIDGELIGMHPQSTRRKLGFMPAEFGSPRSLTIGEYLDYFGCLYEIPPADRTVRIRDVCELTDLSGREDVMVKGLSTGNRQRLLLAKTLLHDPLLLVLDEPASGLDPRARTELRAIIRELAKLDKTIIISSHILPDIEEISDRIGILEAGRLVLDGDLKSLRSGSGAAGRMFKLRVPPEDTARAMELLNPLAGVASCELRDQVIVVGSEEQHGNFVLAALLECGIPILEFVEDTPNLEDIFMRSTAGRVT